MKAELDTGTVILLHNGMQCEICCYLHTTPVRRYAVRDLRTKGVFEVHPNEIDKVISKPKILKHPNDAEIIKNAMTGDRDALIVFLKRFKRLPHRN